MNKRSNLLLLLLQTLSTITYSQDLTTESINNLLCKHPEIEYIKCFDAQSFNYEPFPLSKFPELQPHKGLLAETFILKIPHGQVCSFNGWIKIDNTIVEECVAPYWSKNTQLAHINYAPFGNPKKINGKVAVISSTCDHHYGHWIYNILGRLALLEMYNIEYDWLYVAHDKPFMKETLALWGIDPAKIITPFGATKYIQADELIVPSLVGIRIPEPHQYSLTMIPLQQYCKKWNLSPDTIDLKGNEVALMPNQEIPQDISADNYFTRWTPVCGVYYDPHIIDFIRQKFLSLSSQNHTNFSKRVFISRKISPARTMINEDEVFALFEPYGFTRYSLENMPITEQVTLFNRAEIIVAAHGSALVNFMFCSPHTKVIEIFQSRSDCCFYYLSQLTKLDYYSIQTMDFETIDGCHNTIIPLFIIKNFLEIFFHNSK